MMSQSNPPIVFVLVGLNFGRHIYDHLISDNAPTDIKLAGVCDMDIDKARKLVGDRADIAIYPTLDAVLADENVQAIGLYTGPNGRAKLLDKIIDAGKDVMTTKPFETDPDAAQTVLLKARQMGRVIHLNSPGPGLSDDLAIITKWQKQYQLGRAIGARADVWVSYREQADGRWQDDPDICPAAPVFRLGIYLINDLVQLLGPTKQISVMSSRLFTGRPTADNAQLGIKFENGTLANIFASFCVEDGDHYRNSLTLNFERGTIYRNVGPIRQNQEASLSLVIGETIGQTRQIIDSQQVQLRSGLYNWPGFAKAVRQQPDAPTYDIQHIVEPLRVLSKIAEAEQSATLVDIQH
ncbi:MAG TPA: hypothetical protein DCM28_16970 [Phycisphaerales bacterium]|nr:hypothetical protein [Phycisphaerales bacterium]